MKERLTFGMLGQVFIFSVWQFYCPRRPVPFSNRVCGARNTLAFIAAGRRGEIIKNCAKFIQMLMASIAAEFMG